MAFALGCRESGRRCTAFRTGSGVIASIFKSAFIGEKSHQARWAIPSCIDGGFSTGHVLQRSRNGFHLPTSAAAAFVVSHPAAQGIVQMIGVFMDTVIICSSSAMILLLAGPVPHTNWMLSGYNSSAGAVNPDRRLGLALFACFILMLFAFSSIVVNHLYAENNPIFLKIQRSPHIQPVPPGA